MASRKAGQGSKWIRRDRRIAIYLRDGCACVYCGASGADALLTLDHIVACNGGGDNATGNLVTACRSCNSSKSDLSVRAWYGLLRERGHDTRAIGARVRRLVRKDIAAYRVAAKALLAADDGLAANFGALAAGAK